jgi:DNA topoisomerase I
MVIKWGRNGRFMACSGYPGCKNTKPLAADAEKHQHVVGIKCKVCDGDMIVKGGRFGTFLGCSNYPKCTHTQPISIGIKCPKCKDGDVIERKTKRKRSFYGCSRYPDCDFVSWYKPVLRECEHCKHPYLVEKVSKKKGDYLMCPECKEEFVQAETAIAV